MVQRRQLSEEQLVTKLREVEVSLSQGEPLEWGFLWELFCLLAGEAGFMLLHISLLIPVFYGLILIDRCTTEGLILALVAYLAGLFAFSIHMFLIQRGCPNSRWPSLWAYFSVTF